MSTSSRNTWRTPESVMRSLIHFTT
jgi:hypothetical protein